MLQYSWLVNFDYLSTVPKSGWRVTTIPNNLWKNNKIILTESGKSDSYKNLLCIQKSLQWKDRNLIKLSSERNFNKSDKMSVHKNLFYILISWKKTCRTIQVDANLKLSRVHGSNSHWGTIFVVFVPECFFWGGGFATLGWNKREISQQQWGDKTILIS